MSAAMIVGPGSAAHSFVREQLLNASEWLRDEGVPIGDFSGQLIRPLAALSGLAGRTVAPTGFWQAALAVQLAHEASLVHDDIVDGAATRRGEPTLALRQGVPAALLRGDHLLTASYRAAAATGSAAFMALFARAVERTVAGEAAQGRARGIPLGGRRYEQIVLGKSGELLGCALAAGAVLEGRTEVGGVFELGRRIGLVYQMLDDLLDYCPATPTGKPALGDFRTGRWTWVLGECPLITFGSDEERLLDALYASAEGLGGMASAAKRLAASAEALRGDLRAELGDDGVIGEMIQGWVEQGREAIAREVELRARSVPPAAASRPDRGGGAGDPPAGDTPERPGGETPPPDESPPVAPVLRVRVPALAAAEAFQAAHSRSFRFASRFFPAPERERVERVYAYCRVMDDLVDRPPHGASADDLLGEWVDLSRRAYDGDSSGLPLLDRTMEEMAAGGVPFDYARELAEGMRMDLGGVRYDTLPELREYTYRVASVVGLWVSRLGGIHDPVVLQRAERMGHAMQLTNIVRDVGEDLRAGRLYLPGEMLRRHGVTEEGLRSALVRPGLPRGYAALLEELMSVAEADYAAGLEALRDLPLSFARPVAVAAHVYRGIHREVRKLGYDNLHHRAHTGSAAKALLAGRALWDLGRRPRPTVAAPVPGLLPR
jgi:phytoene synthase